MNPTATTEATHNEPIAIRRAAPADAPALERLRQLDSASLPDGEMLIALAGGRLLAARSLATGESIADPFAPTEHLRDMLATRAGTLTRPHGARHRARGLVGRVSRGYARG